MEIVLQLMNNKSILELAYKFSMEQHYNAPAVGTKTLYEIKKKETDTQALFDNANSRVSTFVGWHLKTESPSSVKCYKPERIRV